MLENAEGAIKNKKAMVQHSDLHVVPWYK